MRPDVVVSTPAGGYAHRMRIRAAIAAAVVATAVVPASAAAADIHASSNGTGVACSSAQPCSLSAATSLAVGGDTVLLEPGNYVLPAGLEIVRGITLARNVLHRGPVSIDPATTPVLWVGGSGLKLSETSIWVMNIAVVGLPSATTAAVWARSGDARLIDVMAVATANSAVGCLLDPLRGGARVTFTLCRGPGGGLKVDVHNAPAQAVRPSFWLQNVTLWGGLASSGLPAPGLVATAQGANSGPQVRLINALIRGTGSADVSDVQATAEDGGRVNVTAATSNYRTRSVIGSLAAVTEPTARNLIQTEDPRVDANWRPRADSPLIDAGGSLQHRDTSYDLDRNYVPTGRYPIGAYEFVPGAEPAPAPAPAPPPGVAVNPGALNMPAGDDGSIGGGTTGGAESAAGAAPTMTARRPTARVGRRALTLRSRVAVSDAGTITQRVTVRRRGRAVVVCRATVDVTAAGTRMVACRMGRAGRAALRRSAQRYTVTTTFANAAGAATATRVLRLGRR